MTGFDSHTEKQLAFSVEQYRELVQHTKKLQMMLDNCEYSHINEHSVRLQELQAVASQHDGALLPMLEINPSAWEGHPLYRMRKHFVRSILELNELLLPKIRGMMAVTSAELEQLQDGRMAITGYALPRTDQRGSRGVG